MAQENDTVYVAITTGFATVNGEQIRFERDKTFVRSGHPLLTQNPGYFVPVPTFLDWPAEAVSRKPWRR
jgi:hypothetical protein